MDATIRVIIIGENTYCIGEIESYFTDKHDIKIVGIASALEAGKMTRKQIETLINNKKPHVILLDDINNTTIGNVLSRVPKNVPVVALLDVSNKITISGVYSHIYIDKKRGLDESFFKNLCFGLKNARVFGMSLRVSQAKNNRVENDNETVVHSRGINTCNEPVELIIIGASAGGADAGLEVMQSLQKGMPCIIMVQHMSSDFTDKYAQRLDSICQMPVREARDGDEVKDGVAFLAPGDYHLTVKSELGKYIIRLNKKERVSGHRPSVSVAFESVARSVGGRAIGVILTGMGSDGAAGLLELRKKGAYTIGQDKKTSLVYGMPRVAREIGAVSRQLPLKSIGGDIIFQVNKRRADK